MSKTFNRMSLFCITAVLICVFCVSAASTVYAAAEKPIPGKPSGLVMSTNWIADAVGQKILDEGGNAIDAAAAVGYALAVVHPTAGNLGGGGFAVIHLANGSSYALDFREMAPASADRLMYVDTGHVSFDIDNPATYRARNLIINGESYGTASLNGYIASGVPGTVAGLNEMVERFGTKSVAEIIEPSIRLAGNGFRLTAGTASSLNGQRATFNRYVGSRKYFTKDGNGGGTFAAGDLFVQKDLAKTLKRIANNPTSRDGYGFYKGLTADMIIADMPKYGGIITHQDLANYKPVWRNPVVGTYRDNFIVVSMSPPSSGGTHIIQMLNTIENENIGTLGFNSLRTIWLMTEAMRYAYADRSEYMGDPDFVNVPIAKLTSKDYGKEIYNKIVAYGFKARPSIEVQPGFGPLNDGTNTTHYSVVDRHGNAVGITYTINMGYGCKAAVDGAGFFMNNEMDDFMTVPGQPNGFGLIQGEANNVQPGKRPLSSMSPTIVVRSSDKSVFLVTGSPGGSQIITTVLHTVVNAIDHGMNVSQMTAAARFHMQWMPDRIQYEPLFGFNNDTIKALSNDLGYTLATASIGDVSAIMVGGRTGTDRTITGAHDPRTFDVPPAFSFDDLMKYVDELPE